MNSIRKAVLGTAMLVLVGAPVAMGQTIDAVDALPTGADGETELATRAPALKIVSVDCTRGKSIMKALKKKADELIIEITGICTEDVVIRRDRVTLRGTDPATDGVRALTTDETFGGAVFVREGRHIRFENLSFVGNTEGSGLRVENSQREVSADNCIFVGNRIGAVAVGGSLVITNSSASSNLRTGLAVGDAGRLTCDNCDILDNFDQPNSGIGVFAVVGGTATVTDSTITNSNIGILTDSSAFALGNRVNITGARFAVVAGDRGTTDLVESTIEGAIFIESQSSSSLIGVTQAANSLAFNFVSLDSHFEVQDSFDTGPSTLVGDLFLDTFSNARIRGNTTLDGVSCDPSAEAFCDGTVTKASSTCGLCP